MKLGGSFEPPEQSVASPLGSNYLNPKKIKSLEEQLVESKNEVDKLTSARLVFELNSKEKKILYSSI